MTFKTRRVFNLKIIFIVLISAIGLQSCSEFLKGKPAEQKTFEINDEDTVCLKQMSQNFKKMFRSESSESEITDTFQCLDNTLTRFQVRVEGKSSSESFTVDELFIIFSKFHKEADLSKQTAIDVLLLKQALLGGSENLITKSEINSLKSYLVIMRNEFLKLRPYLKLYTFQKENGPFSKVFIDSGFLQLKSSLNILLSESKLVKSEYQFLDFKNLLLNLNVFKYNEKDLLDLAGKVKDFLVGAELLRNKSEFELAIDNLTDLMSLSSSILYGHVVFEISNADQMNYAVDFVEKMIQLLMNSVQFQKESELKVSTLDPLIEEIVNRKMLPFEVSAETFKDFYKKLIIRIFSEQKNLSVSSFESVQKNNLQSIRKEMAVFKLYYDFINSNGYKSSSERQIISSVQGQLKTYNVSSNLKNLSGFSDDEKKFILAGFEDLRAEFLSQRPVIYRFNKMVIAENQNIWDVTWADLARGLYGQMMGRELVRGWGDSNVVTEAGLISWYSDFKQFAIEIKSFDPRSESADTGKETFLQANLFAYSGNGDSEMSKTEASQYVNMLVSGGGQTFTEIRDGLKIAGCNLSELDAFGYPWNKEACFYEDFKMNYKYYFSNLSYMVEYLGQLSESEFKTFYDSVMVVARRDAKAIGRIESSDIRSLSMTMMYIESLYAIYDKNNNRSFSAAEIRVAYPRFTAFVTDYAQKNAKPELELWDTVINPCRPLFPRPSFIKEAFIFMAYNGRLPKKADVNDPSSVANIYECGKAQLGFNSTYQPFNFNGEIDRKTIINTFKVLKSALESK